MVQLEQEDALLTVQASSMQYVQHCKYLCMIVKQESVQLICKLCLILHRQGIISSFPDGSSLKQQYTRHTCYSQFQ